MKVYMYSKLSLWFTVLVMLDSIFWIDIYIIFLVETFIFV